MSTATLNTFSQEAAEAAVEASGDVHRVIGTMEIEVRTVAQILREYSAVPDFLTIDVEGGDLMILRTMPDWPDLPTVVCVETITYSEHGRGEKIPELGESLHRLGYIPYADPISTPSSCSRTAGLATDAARSPEQRLCGRGSRRQP